MLKKLKTLTALFCLIPLWAYAADDAKLPSNAPEDKPVDIESVDEAKKLEQMLQPYIEQARKTWPDAKERYLKGLPEGEIFFVTTRLIDKKGNMEQVFVAVKGIEGQTIKGNIRTNLRTVKGYRYGQAYSFNEKELIDWLVMKPDGSQEGNVVGKFLESRIKKVKTK